MMDIKEIKGVVSKEQRETLRNTFEFPISEVNVFFVTHKPYPEEREYTVGKKSIYPPHSFAVTVLCTKQNDKAKELLKSVFDYDGELLNKMVFPGFIRAVAEMKVLEINDSKLMTASMERE